MVQKLDVKGDVAVLGGPPRLRNTLPRQWRHYPCRREGGAGSARRLIAAIKSGKVARVVILVRSNAHSDTIAVRGACRRAGVPFELSARAPTSTR